MTSTSSDISAEKGKSMSDGIAQVKRHVEEMLDEALDESFPASGHVSVTCAKLGKKLPRSR